MKKEITFILFITFFILASISTIQAQVDTLWSKTFGGIGSDLGYSVQQTTDSGYIIAGTTSSFGAGSFDVWLIKTDASGNTLWTKTTGGSDIDIAYSVQQTTDGGYIIAGKAESFSAGSSDVWLIKTDSSGTTLWTKIFGGVEDEYAYSVDQTTDGGYIITGAKSVDPYPYRADIWLIKTDASGDTLWTKTYGTFLTDTGYYVQQTSDGGYFVLGYSSAIGTDFVWLIKTDAFGDTLWTKRFDGGVYQDAVSSAQQTVDGGYIITGITNSFGAGEPDVWLIKTDTYGDTLWTKTFGGIESDGAFSVQQTTDGGYIIAGWTISYSVGDYDVWLIKTNASGDTLWTKNFGGTNEDRAYSVQQTTDGGYIVAGWTNSFGAGSSDIWLIKIAPVVSNVELDTDIIPSDFSLSQNFPNPFNPTTKIKFQIPNVIATPLERGKQSQLVILKVYDVLGNEITTLINEEKPAGIYEVNFNAVKLPSGIYFYKLQVGSFIDTKKMVLLK